MYKFQVSESTNSHSDWHSHEPFNHPAVAVNNATSKTFDILHPCLGHLYVEIVKKVISLSVFLVVSFAYKGSSFVYICSLQKSYRKPI